MYKATDERLIQHARTLVEQGEWATLFKLQSRDTSFQGIVRGVSEATYRWLIKAVTNTAPTMSYLHKINRATTRNCPRCGRSPETLHHALNNCPKALQQGIFTWRHNEVLAHIYAELLKTSGELWEIRADIAVDPSTETIPSDILVTPLKPDATMINRTNKSLVLIELTICWDSNFENARSRKQQRYSELLAELEENDWKCQLATIEIGSRGFSSNSTATQLKSLFKDKFMRAKVLTRLNQIALSCSYCIFIHRNNRDWSPCLQ